VIERHFEDQNLALRFVHASEQAALAALPWHKKMNPNAADRAAAAAMRDAFVHAPIRGTVAVGEIEMGELDHTHGMSVGEKFGKWREEDRPIVAAVDVLEGSKALAEGLPGSCSVIAYSEAEDGFAFMEDMYMYKIACGPAGRGHIDVTVPASENVRRVAKAKGVPLSRVTVAILNRIKHLDLIAEVASTGAQVRTFAFGDLMMGVATAREESGIDLVIGEGGAPEGVLTAAALYCMGGDFQGLLCPITTESDPVQRAKLVNKVEMLLKRPIDRPLRLHDLVRNNVAFAATGITDGIILPGIRPIGHGKLETTTLITRSQTRSVRWVRTEHPRHD